MGKVKQIEIKNRTYYFYNDMINLKNFESNLLKIDKKHYKGIDIYYIGYITIKIAREYIEEKNGNKYLIFDDSVNENKALLKNMQMFGMELKTKSKQLMVVKKIITEKIT